MTKKNNADLPGSEDKQAKAEQQQQQGKAGAATAEKKDPLAAYRGDLTAAEQKAAKMVDYRIQLPAMAIGMMLVLVSLFLPHSRDVLGIDVLFNSATAQKFQITMPERVYSILAVIGGILLTAGTIVSRSWLVAWVNWAVVGVGWWYSVFAIWMRQSRPVTDPAGPPSYGLIMGAIGMTILFIMTTWVLFRRNPLQRALAQARREEAHRSEEAKAAQQRLRTGVEEWEQASLDDIVDDRRARAKQRRRKAQANAQAEKGKNSPSAQGTGSEVSQDAQGSQGAQRAEGSQGTEGAQDSTDAQGSGDKA